jgi:nucleotide-binding universal stress UspA family protein
MATIRSVLAATDFSQPAALASARAALVAAEHGARFQLVHVVEQQALVALRDWLAPGRDLRAAVAEQAEMQLAAAARQLLDAWGVQPQTSLLTGQPLQEIQAAAAQADLLVLGGRGDHFVRDVTIGTTADRLLRCAATPLLVVKAAPTASYGRVLVLVDFSPASQAALEAAARVAPGAALRLLHAFDLPFEGKLRVAGVGEEQIEHYRAQGRQEAMEQFRRMLDGNPAGERATLAIEHGNVRLEFLRAVEEFRPDLVAIGKQGQGFLSDLLLGSVTRIVLAEAGCDVLVVPRAAQAPAA